MMERLSERIAEHGGVIVDYAGDGILAMWNAPVPQEDHRVRACRAALAMIDELPGLNARWGGVAAEPLRLGVGLNTGIAQVGNTGSSRKLKYGPHGHTVNVASRIQDASKRLRVPLLVSETTHERLPKPLATRRVGRVRLAGIAEPVTIYELQGEAVSAEWLARRDAYEAALTLYESGQWTKACQALTALMEPGKSAAEYDPPTLRLARRAFECLESPPPCFDPVLPLENPLELQVIR
jgi:adenylate cyclase